MVKNALCVGLDFRASLNTYIDYIELIDADIYKFNPAFNPEVIFELAKYFREKNILWIYDGKLGDVEHTNEAYADYVFNQLGAWGVTLNPYLGFQSLEPFFKYADKFSFILCKTTNFGAELFQQNNYKKIKEFVKHRSNLGLVYAGNDESGLRGISVELPNNYILAPGIGVQGGEIKYKCGNIIYSVSRSIFKSPEPKKVAELFKYKIKEKYLLKYLDKYIERGTYTLSSGERSNYYINLKALTEDVFAFNLITAILASEINVDSILGIESGSISYAAATAFQSKKSFGFIRSKVKDYGTERQVEGLSKSSKEVAIIEDVLTTGKSLEEAIIKAESCGFKIKQVIVIVSRNKEYKCKYPYKALLSFP